MIQVEICAASVASAIAAKQGGAQRIELCRNLECGGLTPSDDDIEYCVRTLGLRTHVLVRPRPGDFCYSQSEVDEIMSTIDRCRRLGAAAVVVGFLDAQGRIDIELTRSAVRRAQDMEVTFHRAFDGASLGPLWGLSTLSDCGCTRLLTSGQKPTAMEGAGLIRQLVEQSKSLHHFQILAGSGVTPDNARQLVLSTGVREIHGSCKRLLPDGTWQTDATLVRQLLSAVEDL